MIQIPPGPYPKCGDAKDTGAICEGTMFPCAQPTQSEVQDYFTGVYTNWNMGTMRVFWKCSKCGKVIG